MDLQTRYNTEDVAPADRFSYWRESVCDSYVRLGCEAENKSEFRGLIDIARHSVVSISQVAGRAHLVERRKRDIRASSDAYFLLSLQTAESCRVTQFGESADLRRGDMALYSSSDPYRLDLSDDFSQTVVQLPATKLLDRLPHAETLVARRIDGQSGIGRLVHENILAFSQQLAAPDPVLQNMLQETLIDLIATGLAARGAQAAQISAPEQQVMLRATAFIRDNLGDPTLDRARVAAAMHMSVRRLSEIFANNDQTISGYIRQKRLDGVAADLKDCRFDPQSISEIAFRHGFSNMQNFSTLFRQIYGQSPRAFRTIRS
ncbi:helix-turn-helix domain-containing protein [Gymnodinialimonas sp. 2305UL16-5]|uniref:AraC-like ligand-binding domain-containing protein n=1 Tax=Gymnodinialimonas mytili TaxID=3126503 RepID=UPI0030A7E0F5